MKQKNAKLTDKQEAFSNEYLIDFCAAKAAKRAGYSPKVANIQGYKNLQNPIILQRIEVLKKVLDAGRSKKIANRLERQEFWTEMMYGKVDDACKLRASELLGKSEADFIEVHANKDVPRKTLTESERLVLIGAARSLDEPKVIKLESA